MLNDTILRELRHNLESDRAERKAGAGDRKAIRRTICAFANDLPGNGEPGVVFVGIRDDGTCADFEVTDDLLKLLADMRTSGILPQPSIDVRRVTIDGCTFAVVEVQPSGEPPVRLDGRVWVRVGPTTREATRDDERRLTERRRARDLPFDRRPAVDAEIDDLDLTYFEREYRRAAVSSEIIEQNDRALEQQLDSLRPLNSGKPCYGAILLLASDPLRWIDGAYVQFVRIDGTSLGDSVRDQKSLSGPLHQIAHELDSLLELNIQTPIEITGSSREQRSPDYPLVALQQVVRNALVHRDYETSNAPVRIYWFSDRIEVHSPGGLYGQVSEATFGKGPTDYRNPLIAEGMATLGYVQKFGFGIPLAVRECEKNGNPPPEFSFTPSSVLTTIRSAP